LRIRLIGYIAFSIVVLFIIIGFFLKKTSLIWISALIIFLPVFGQFALSMFFLSGLGILRTIWMPFIDSSVPLLEIGSIIYLPYNFIMWLFGLLNFNAHYLISWVCMATGSLLFVYSVFIWIKDKFQNIGVSTSWIYKYSRHPQYLGWIIWSYGIMLYSTVENNMKKSWSIGNSFPWLLSLMIIIAICMIEELNMSKKNGEKYDNYRDRTPFLFPIPELLKKLIKLPSTIVIKSSRPNNIKQVILIILIYMVILITPSLFLIENSYLDNTSNNARELQTIITSIDKCDNRKQLYNYFHELKAYEQKAIPILELYLTDSSDVKKEFAANILGDLKSVKSVNELIKSLNDNNWRVRNSSALALSAINDTNSYIKILEVVETYKPDERSQFYSLLGSINDPISIGILIDGTNHYNWYSRISALNSLYNIGPEDALPYIYNALSDSDPRVRKNAVFIIIKDLPHDAIPHLEPLVKDEDFEISFYASQAIKMINEKI
jgi:protein-S-isoprenylcysteine O-methyltransferase Ste14/uncharacterized protein YxeA